MSLKKLKRTKVLFFITQNFRTYYVRNFRFCQISEIVNKLLTIRIL